MIAVAGRGLVAACAFAADDGAPTRPSIVVASDTYIGMTTANALPIDDALDV